MYLIVIKKIFSLQAKKLTEDIHELTKMANTKVDQFGNDIEDVVQSSKETYKTLLKTAEDEKTSKDNRCCIMFLLVIAVVFLVLILMNMQR